MVPYLLIYLLLPFTTSEPPNIIFFLVDDLGWWDIGFHNPDVIITPHVDRLAREGVLLGQHYVSPVCTPSRASLLTGMILT